MDTKNMIEITGIGIDLRRFVKTVYDLSSPQGLGFLHFTLEPLTDGEAQEIVDTWKDDKQMALGLDYIKGRSCKMDVFREGKKLYIFKNWHDHSPDDLKELLCRCGLKERSG